MFALPQASYQSGNSYDNSAYFYDPGAKKWARGGKPSFRVGPDSGCDYWPKGNELICSTANGVAAYNLDAKAWKLIGSGDNQDFGRTAIVDPVRNIFVQIWGKQRPLAVYDLSSPSPRRNAAPVVGNAEFGGYGTAGLAYHTPTGRYVVWPGGREVWTVEPGPVRWTATKYTAENGPPYRSIIGIYGKWQYVPSLDVFIGVRWWDEPVYLYKLPKPGEVAGDTRDTTSIRPPSVVVAGIRDGQTIDLPKGRFRDAIVINANDVTIRGYDTVLFEAAAKAKAAIINNGRDNRIEGLTVENARGSGNTGCVYHGGTNLTMFRVTLRGCEMNVRTNNGDERGFFHFDQSLSENSVGSSQLGHNFYINQISRIAHHQFAADRLRRGRPCPEKPSEEEYRGEHGAGADRSPLLAHRGLLAGRRQRDPAQLPGARHPGGQRGHDRRCARGRHVSAAASRVAGRAAARGQCHPVRLGGTGPRTGHGAYRDRDPRRQEDRAVQGQ